MDVTRLVVVNKKRMVARGADSASRTGGVGHCLEIRSKFGGRRRKL